MSQEGDLRAKVAVMRELGVVQWDGITLGPEPQKPAADLTAEELAAAREGERLQEMRDRLAASGHEYTDDELRSMM